MGREESRVGSGREIGEGREGRKLVKKEREKGRWGGEGEVGGGNR